MSPSESISETDWRDYLRAFSDEDLQLLLQQEQAVTDAALALTNDRSNPAQQQLFQSHLQGLLATIARRSPEPEHASLRLFSYLCSQLGVTLDARVVSAERYESLGGEPVPVSANIWAFEAIIQNILEERRQEKGPVERTTAAVRAMFKRFFSR